MKAPSSDQLKALTESYLKGTISESDKKALEAWYMSMPDTEVEWDDPDVDSSKVLQSRMYKAIESQIKNNTGSERRLKYYLQVAAAVVILFTAVSFFYLQYLHSKKDGAENQVAKNDVQPGVSRAALTLSNGKTILLDSAHSVSAEAGKGRIRIIGKNGAAEYVANTTRSAVYNTLTTDRGEQAPPLVLDDGTKVWLNAASSLRFPASFNGKNREIVLSGEAYFEIAKDPSRPFFVHTGTSRVEVLGTHFDVMAYPDERFIYSTLLKGSIRMINGRNSVLLSPGEQGRISGDGAIEVRKVNVSQSVAWLHGQLPMENMDIETFMRQVSRWYNVDIVYDGKLPVLNFSGSLNKEVPLSQILAALNGNGVHCRLEEKTVIVSGK